MSQQGYFDLQVNGYAGVSFRNDAMTIDDLRRACEAMKKDGTDIFLATLTTDDVEKICARLRRIVKFREQDPFIKQMIPGFHIEGPYISSEDGYRGAHARQWAVPANVEGIKKMLDAANGLTKLVTLAPELDEGFKATRLMADQGIRVAAGHCNPSFDQLKASIDAGLSMYTHLGNGCPMQMHRHDNVLQRALALSDRLHPCFIADGAHVSLFALKNYLKIVGTDRAIVVTDAVAHCGLGPGKYIIGNWGEVTIGDDLVALSPDKSHLLGSVMPFPRQEKNLKEHCGMTQQQVDQLTKLNPRRVMGI